MHDLKHLFTLPTTVLCCYVSTSCCGAAPEAGAPASNAGDTASENINENAGGPERAARVALDLQDRDVILALTEAATAFRQPIVIAPRAHSRALGRRITVVVDGSIEQASVVQLLEEALKPLGLRMKTSSAGWVVLLDEVTNDPHHGGGQDKLPTEPKLHPEVPHDSQTSGSSTTDEEMPKPLLEGITRLSPTHYQVSRKTLEMVAASPTLMMREARIVPMPRNSKLDGVRLFGIRRGSILQALGLRNGDLVYSIMGRPVSSPEQALEAYVKMRDASTIPIDIYRQGERLQLRYDIVP